MALNRHMLLLMVAALGLEGAWAFGEAEKYLIVSAPSTHRIAYMKLENGRPADNPEMRTLIDYGLYVPQGIAVDQYRRRLYVADPDLGKLVSYDLVHRGDALEATNQRTVAHGVETRWVAVDGLGNVVFTDEARNKIMRVTAQQIENGDTTASTVYDGASVNMVSAPGGIAVDNYFIHWANKASGTQVGTLVKARQSPNVTSPQTSVGSLATNAMKCYGVCLALGNIFYTDELRNLYAVRRNGGTPVTINTDLSEPRGCAFDGDGTVFIADKTRNAVYGFPSNLGQITANPQVRLTKAVDFQGAYGVAVYVKVEA